MSFRRRIESLESLLRRTSTDTRGNDFGAVRERLKELSADPVAAELMGRLSKTQATRVAVGARLKECSAGPVAAELQNQLDEADALYADTADKLRALVERNTR